MVDVFYMIICTLFIFTPRKPSDCVSITNFVDIILRYHSHNSEAGFTVRNEATQVMLLQACVCPPRGCLLPGGGAGLVQGGGIPACTEANPHPGRDGYCCGRYASYWNAFLFSLNLKWVLHTACFGVDTKNVNVYVKSTLLLIVGSFRLSLNIE